MSDPSLLKGDLGLNYAQLTDAGGRASNQDALASAEQDELVCFVVSDGVGGHEGGEIASHTVVEAVIGRFLQEAAFGPRALQSYIDCAAVQVAQRKSHELRLQEMSATVAAVLIDPKNRTALWAHIGDTRVYLFRHDKLHCVTKDHSLVQQMVDGGYCSPDQLRTHPQRSALCAAIGMEGESSAEVTQTPAMLEAGDAFLICTDGFWEWITEQEMEHTAATSRSAEEWLAAMHNVVKKNGSLSGKSCDNYTAFTIYFKHIQQ